MSRCIQAQFKFMPEHARCIASVHHMFRVLNMTTGTQLRRSYKCSITFCHTNIFPKVHLNLDEQYYERSNYISIITHAVIIPAMVITGDTS